tara:strand:+ start:561 stop:2225 length:1665 start_codon:yes stop_codon:yes gene_type:complete
MIFLIFIINISLAGIPFKYMLLSESDRSGDALPSNQILDIEVLNNDIYLSTGDGLGKSSSLQSLYSFNRILSDEMVEGGNPSLAISDNVIAVSGSRAVLELGAIMPSGTGVSYSVDLGDTWNYMPQPIDDMPALWSCSNKDGLIYSSKVECEQNCQTCPNSSGLTESASCGNLYEYISWGGQDNIIHLSVTTEINNLAYDLEIYGDYIYAANWAGGLRRFNYNSDNPSWEVVPLPMDDQDELLCGSIEVNSYQLNPVGNCYYENFNHRPFSVKVIDGSIWVGTAGGINKGSFDGDCIDWEHFRYLDKGFYDDWIIGFEKQELSDGSSRIWALTWDKSTEGEVGPPSFSDDGGLTWQYSNQIYYLGATSYNISFNGNLIYLSTDQGLFISQDGIFWENFNSFVDYETGERVLSEIVYDTKFINNNLWVATNDGVAISSDSESPNDWLVYRFWNDMNQFSAYPNPFLINDYNVVNGHGHMRFVSKSTNANAVIDIFDFSMDKVVTLNSPLETSNQIEFIWNGKSEYGGNVQNGVYFCRLNDNGEYSWVKVAVLSEP